MADKRNRTPFYGAVPTSKLQSDHVFMADGSTLEDSITTLNNEVTVLREYSLEEQLIGKYADGKPLYRKTFTVTSPATVNTSVNVVDITALDVENITYDFFSIRRPVNATTSSNNDNAIMFYRFDDITGDFIALSVKNSAYLSVPTLITIEYTKTTDSANRSLLRKIDKAIKTSEELQKRAVEAEEQEG